MSKKDNVAAVPKYRFPEFALDASIDYIAGGFIFDPITNRNHHADLPILAITQEYGAIPRDEIHYKVSVTKKSLKAYKIVEKGDFIISLRSFQGGIEYSMYDGICSPAYIILRKKTNIIDRYYKYYFKSHRFIQGLNKDLEGIRDGKMISYGQFSSILLPKPDEEEQQKIADCLSSIDDLISAEEKKLSLLNDYKKGWMQKLFPTEGKIVPEWRFPEFRDSGEWENTTIGKIADYENGKAHENNIIDNGKYIVVNSKFISTEGEIIKYTNEANLLAYKGDILMVLSDVPNGRALSKCYLVDKDNLYTVNQRVCRITSQKVNSILLFYTINRNKYFLAFDDGVKQTNLRKDDVLHCSIVIPKDANEQEKIADFLSGIDDLIGRQTDKIEALKQHKKALMQGLFPVVKEVWK
ncbi:restriction endonuclease subunit S [Veillonella atypica]|jgi:restriction modification system DNA specificity domain protein|uniref:restriction endonuclease subunit S n=1 Tax=Veillonella atypica TaxID=39777 RepID=UPI00352E4D40